MIRYMHCYSERCNTRLTEVLTAASAIYMLFAGENALPPWHELYTPTKHNRKEAY